MNLGVSKSNFPPIEERPYGLHKCVGLLLLVVISLFLSSKDAKAQPEGSVASRSPEPFIFIGVYGAGAGGRTVADRFVIVSGTNYAQSSSIMHEAVIAMEEKRVSATSLFKHVATLGAELPRAFVRRGENLQSVDGFIPTYVRISFQLYSGQTYDWADYEKELSTNQKEIIQRMEEIVRTGQSLTNEKPLAYLAAYWLDDRTASQFKQQGLLHAIAPESSATKSPLIESLRHPFRLLPLNRDANPFQPFRRSLQPGRDVLDVTFSGKNFQVRSYSTTNQK